MLIAIFLAGDRNLGQLGDKQTLYRLVIKAVLYYIPIPSDILHFKPKFAPEFLRPRID